MNKKGLIGNLIGAFVAIIIGIALFPMISEVVTNVTIAMNNTSIDGNNSEYNDFSSFMLSCIPFIFAFGIFLMALNIVYQSLKSEGLLGGDEYGDDDDFNGDGVVDDNEAMLGELYDGDYPEEDKEERIVTEAEKDLKHYIERNKKILKESKEDESNDESFINSETEPPENFKTKEIESPENFNTKETFYKSKPVSEKKLKKSRFD